MGLTNLQYVTILFLLLFFLFFFAALVPSAGICSEEINRIDCLSQMNLGLIPVSNPRMAQEVLKTEEREHVWKASCGQLYYVPNNLLSLFDM